MTKMTTDTFRTEKLTQEFGSNEIEPPELMSHYLLIKQFLWLTKDVL